jgi:mannosyltransferase
LAGWQALFGDLQGAVRALSALCGIVTLPIFFLAARRLFDQPTALIATLILAASPIHVRYAQEARMYGLLTLAVAVGLYCLAQILMEREQRPLRRLWLGLSVAQAAIMLTHNTATVFFPVALNLAIGTAIAWKYWQGGVSSWPALNAPGFERQWLRSQALAIILWLPWSIPFVIQAVMVDRSFWIPALTWPNIWQVFHNFNAAFLPEWFPVFPWWDGLYWVLAGLGILALRAKPARMGLLVSLWLVPIGISLLVSLRRPIFIEQTLLWTTIPYYLLVAMGIRRLGTVEGVRWVWLSRPVQALLLAALLVVSATSLVSYYFYFEKEDWAKAASYVAENIEPKDAIVFHATWGQLPFNYYFRHYEQPNPLHGLPVDLFSRGELEPAMTTADLPQLRALTEEYDRIWLIYAHDWYTDPTGIIPRELGRMMRRTDEQQFVGLQVMRFDAR